MRRAGRVKTNFPGLTLKVTVPKIFRKSLEIVHVSWCFSTITGTTTLVNYFCNKEKGFGNIVNNSLFLYLGKFEWH